MGITGLDLYITTTCDRRCTHCFLTDEWLNSNQRMSLGMVADVANWATTPGSKVKEFTLLGGEPSRHPEFADIARTVANAGLGVRVVTNGSPAFRKALGTNPDLADVITRTSLSCDAPTEEAHDAIRGKGTFDWVLATAEELKSRVMPFDVNYTVLKDNLYTVPGMLRFSEELGANRLNIHWFTKAGRGRVHASDQEATPDEWAKKVVKVASEYQPSRPDFVVDCELAFASGFPGENHDMCAVQQNTNLQISPDGSALQCGMLAETPELSAYLWKNSNLYPRTTSPNEITMTQQKPACGGCPLRQPVDGITPLCIYNRLAHSQTTN